MSWSGIRAEFISVNRTEAGISNELFTDRHVMFLGVGGTQHEVSIQADGLPKWRGMKGQDTSSFYAAGCRMRSWHAPGASDVVVMFFDPGCIEALTHDERAATWQSRVSTDEGFISANAAHLAAALKAGDDDLVSLRAETIATSLHLYCAERFSSLGSQHTATGNGVGRAIDLIHAVFPRATSLEDLADASGLSRRQLLIDFPGRTGTSPHQYILRERLSRAQFLLTTTTKPLAEIARDVGCANADHLGRLFRQHFDMSPRAWKAKAVR